MANVTFLAHLAEVLGASEPALRLLFSLLIGYPLLLFHRLCLHSQRPHVQHMYFILCGAAICMFNYGPNVIHSVICIFSAWVILILIGGSLASVIVAFVFQMGYLVTAYYRTATDTYDIKWTMPHCVLTLRLIALTFDVYDGTRKPEDMSTEQRKTALRETPSLLEIAAHTYFPASFMVGPQFSMNRYLDFVHKRLYPEDAPSPVALGLMRGALGLFYLAVYRIGNGFFPDAYFLTDSYLTMTFWRKLVVVGIWGKIILYKYVSCWLITEGACIMSGLSYSGKDASGTSEWKGCRNVKIAMFESATKFEHLIASFNTNTNAWVAQYVYKRLRFLNNRNLSQAGALLFLAVWHGVHSGYYACFFMEFIVMMCERGFNSVILGYPSLMKLLGMAPYKYLKLVILKVYVLVFMGYCLASFVLLCRNKWWIFYKSTYFSGHIIFGGWILYKPMLSLLLQCVFGAPAKKSDFKPPADGRHKIMKED